MGIDDPTRKVRGQHELPRHVQRSENSSTTRIILPVENRSFETTEPSRITLYRLDGEQEAIVDGSKILPSLGVRENVEIVFLTSGKISQG
jgi:hypothetical protein